MTFGIAGQSFATRVKWSGRFAFLCLLLAASVHAGDGSFTNLLALGEMHEQRQDTRAALDDYLAAEKLDPTNAALLCHVAKQYCDMMHQAKSEAEKKGYAAKSLIYADRAVAEAPESPQAHLCVAVCCAKNFPFLDNQTKVNYSRRIKIEAEKAIALDPKYDLPYHMLGRWNCEVANMNLILKGVVRMVYGGLPKASNDLAIQDFKKAIELSPGRIIHHLQLAHVYHLSGKTKLAVTELKTCQTLTPIDLDDTDAKRIAAKVLATGRWPAVF